RELYIVARASPGDRPRLAGRFDRAIANGDGDRVRAGVRVELAHDVAQVGPHRVRAHAEVDTDLLGRAAVGEAAEHVALAHGKLVRAAHSRLPRGHRHQDAGGGLHQLIRTKLVASLGACVRRVTRSDELPSIVWIWPFGSTD